MANGFRIYLFIRKYNSLVEDYKREWRTMGYICIVYIGCNKTVHKFRYSLVNKRLVRPNLPLYESAYKKVIAF